MNRHERFMAKVRVQPGEQCWIWLGCKNAKGYGQFWSGERNIPAHWFLLDRKPNTSKGEEACHSCDNPSCVRPSHLFIGSRSDNVQDCVRKNRHNAEAKRMACRSMLAVRRVHIGVNNHECKLSEDQAREAKNCPRKYGAATAMARRFGVSTTVICDIRDGKRWTHL